MGMGMDRALLPSTRQAPPRVSPVVLQLALRAREASGARHCRSHGPRATSTGETGVQCSVLCTLTAAVTRGGADRVAHALGWSHCRSSYGDAWTCSPKPMAESHKPPSDKGPLLPLGGPTCRGDPSWTPHEHPRAPGHSRHSTGQTLPVHKTSCDWQAHGQSRGLTSQGGPQATHASGARPPPPPPRRRRC